MGSAMFLSTYQRAILQEMGIPVWIEQTSKPQDANVTVGSTGGVSNNTPHATHSLTSEDKQARLAQLRAQVTSASQGEPSQSSVSNNKNTDSVPLTAKQHKQASLWLKDLDIALFHVGVSLTSEQVTLGQEIQVTEREVRLVAPPHQLSAAQRKLLWQALCAAADKK